MLTVTGIFKELESGQKSAPIRAFSKVLVIVPAGSGFCIVNEQIHVTNATEAQTKVIISLLWLQRFEISFVLERI